MQAPSERVAARHLRDVASPGTRRRSSVCEWLVLYFYSAMVRFVLKPVAIIGSWISSRWRTQIKGRDQVFQELSTLKAEAARHRRRAVFLCSSAGEYEQAKPVIDRLMQNDKVFVVIFFFSRSGYRYAEKLKEETPYYLAPFDTLSAWRPVMAALRPNLSVVVRHELWPIFLWASSWWGRVILIDASCPQGKVRNPLKTWLLGFFDHIFTVSAADQNAFDAVLKKATLHVDAVGDTKYDRVVQRQQQKADAARTLGNLLDSCFPAERRLIVGSAWPEDTELVLGAFVSFLRDQRNHDWALLIAPHETDQQTIQSVTRQCDRLGLPWTLFSELNNHPVAQPATVLIVDTMGILAELYSTASAAFVGGSMTRKIHNVLEPASYGLSIAFGPCFKNQMEAILLEEQELASVIMNGEGMLKWLRGLDDRGQGRDHNILDFITNLCGATDRITRKLADYES